MYGNELGTLFVKLSFEYQKQWVCLTKFNLKSVLPSEIIKFNLKGASLWYNG